MDEPGSPSGDVDDDYIDQLVPGRRARFEALIERVRQRKGSPPRDPTKRSEIHPVEDDDEVENDGDDGQGPVSQ